MKKKILYIVLGIIFIIALILTVVIGLRVDLNYAEGYTITFTAGKEIKIDEIEDFAKETFNDNEIRVQQVELFGDSALIKTRKNITEEQLSSFCTKINEKYGIELKTSNFEVTHIPNTKLRNVLEPYIIPLGLSTLLIVGYYAIRFKGVKRMLGLLKSIVIVEGLLYSLYAICRIPVNELTMPIALVLYTLTVLVYSLYCEMNPDIAKTRNEK